MAVLIVTLLLSFLMVSTIKYRSFKDLKFRGRQHITYLVWGILALVLVAAWPEVMLFVMFAGYALLGPIERDRDVGQIGGKTKERAAGQRTKILAATTRSSKQRFGKRMLKAVTPSKAAVCNIL